MKLMDRLYDNAVVEKLCVKIILPETSKYETRPVVIFIFLGELNIVHIHTRVAHNQIDDPTNMNFIGNFWFFLLNL